MNEIFGIIYPVPVKFVDRFFNVNVMVFVKYVAHNTTRLAPKHRVIFYASHGSKKLIGEGTIEKVEFLTPDEVLAKYKDELFLDEAEFNAYIRRSPSRTPSRKMLVLQLKKLRKYGTPIDYNKPMTMAGQYLSAEEYKSMIGN